MGVIVTGESKKEFTLRISQANPTEIIVITYEIALNYFEDAETALHENQRDELKSAVSHIQKCISALMESLDFTQEIAMRLMELYTYANREIAKFSVNKKEEHLKNAEYIFRELLPANQEVSKQDERKAVMENVQTVYAGLTYGKNDLVENNVSTDWNTRGFRA